MNNIRIIRSASVCGRSVFAIVLVVLFASTIVLASTPQGTFEKTLTVIGPVDLEVLTHFGAVTVRAGSSGSVFIREKIYVGNHWLSSNRDADVHEIEQHPPIRQEGNSIHIDYVNMRNISVDYEISVPADTTVRTRSGSGDQIIEGTRGNVDTQTGSGNIRARQISGPVKGGTGSGDIEIDEAASGDIDLHTGSGNINARGVQGGFQGETGSGDVTAEGTQSGAWDVRTGSGNVHVRLPANAAFDADISTSSGTIDVGSPIEMTVQGRVNDAHKQIHGKVHGGGPLLKVRTGSGDIHIQ